MKATEGFNLIGDMQAATGIAEGARGLARALDDAKIPFGVRHIELEAKPDYPDLSCMKWQTEHAPYNSTILSCCPFSVISALTTTPAEFYRYKHLIGYWAWETPEIS